MPPQIYQLSGLHVFLQHYPLVKTKARHINELQNMLHQFNSTAVQSKFVRRSVGSKLHSDLLKALSSKIY